MSFKKTNKLIDELAICLFIVEGEVTDLLTRDTMQNLNASSQTTMGAVAIGSALIGQIGNAALANFAASDEGIDVSDFAVEVTDQEGVKHYFTGCFPVVVFKSGDRVQVVAEPIYGEKKYTRAVAVIDQDNDYIWTSQEVVKGRMRYRIFGMKIGGGVVLLSIFIFIIFFLFLEDGYLVLLDPLILGTLLFCTVLFIYGGWKIGGGFDDQSVELEAILKKLGFNKPSRIDLQNYALTDLSWQNKNSQEKHERWKDYTYRLDLAQQADKEKYGKS